MGDDLPRNELLDLGVQAEESILHWSTQDLTGWFGRVNAALIKALGVRHGIAKNFAAVYARVKAIEGNESTQLADLSPEIMAAVQLLYAGVSELSDNNLPEDAIPPLKENQSFTAQVQRLEPFDGRINEWLSRAWLVPIIRPDDLGTPPDAADADAEFDRVMLWFFRSAKEMVFGLTPEGKYFLCPIGWVVDPSTLMQTLRPMTKFITVHENMMRVWLFQTMMADVPIVPDTPDAGEHLARIYSGMRDEGFELSHPGGGSAKVELSREFFRDPMAVSPAIRSVVQPFELEHAFDELRREQRTTAKAKAAISRIDTALEELTNLLRADTRNEHDLQRCLTRNPILFGTEYARMIPKHKLGSDYETDYALELVDGSIDVVEIEASTHALYTKGGNPTAALTHAEQQVQDWLAWLDEHASYARSKLPGVRRARGIVVMGRRNSLTDKNKVRLSWRNSTFAGRITVLTFDDLVDRCSAIRSLLLEEARTGNEQDTTASEAS